jgi:hypothetical protein
MFNLIDELSAVSFPVVIPKLTVVVLLTREATEPDKFSGRLVLSFNGQVPLLNMEWPFDFQKKYKARAIGELQGIVIPASGILRASLYDDQKELAGWDIDLRFIGAPHADLFSTVVQTSAVLGQPSSGVANAKIDAP